MKKYIRLYERLKSDILSGVYKAGDRLPSKRTVADLSGTSLTTVETVYGMLIDEGYAFSVEKRGYYVAEISEMTGFSGDGKDKKLTLLPLPSRRDCKVDFECSIWFKTVRRVMNDSGELLFQRSPQKGCEVLRNAIAEYLLRYRKMIAQPSNIIIGSGAEQLYATAVLLLGKDKKYGIESPCYSKIPAVYGNMGAKTVALRMGNDGIKTSELSKDYQVLHVTPFHSFPSGITTSLSKRMKYLSIAAKAGNYIIEDDYDSEFFTKGHPVDTLFSLCKNGKVIYINTFSKSLSGSMRIGYMIIPDSLTEKYDQMTKNISCTVPVLDQYVLADFIASGGFERHLARKRRLLYGTDSRIKP